MLKVSLHRFEPGTSGVLSERSTNCASGAASAAFPFEAGSDCRVTLSQFLVSHGKV